MKDKFQTFQNNVNGQHIEVSDFTNEFQCYDLAFCWVFCLGFPKQSIGGHLYAYEIFTLPSDLTRQYFDIIPNTPTGVPQVGDLIVFGTGVGVAGHVCISNGIGDVNTFQSLDQNWAGKNYATTVTHNYTNVLGWLRPKMPVNAPVITDQTIIPQIIDASGHAMEVQAIRSTLADQELEITHLKTQIDNLLSQTTTTTITTMTTPPPTSMTTTTQPVPPSESPFQLLTRFWNWIKSLFGQ